MERPENDGATAIPVSVLTGFLGSGKTTLLKGLLEHPDMEQTAVLINEFGEIGLDHMLVREVSEDTILLNSGCLCCTVRGDLVDALRDLFIKRTKGEIPEFRRVLIETTGLADPAPIIHTMMTDPLLSVRYRLDGIITTVDAKHGLKQLDNHKESVKQAAVADRIVLTKTDIAPEDGIQSLQARLKSLNPAAPVFRIDHGKAKPNALLDAGLFNPKTKIPDVARWLNAEAYAEPGHDHDGHGHGHDDHDHGHDHAHGSGKKALDVNRHDDRISAFCMTLDRPVSWDALVAWLDALISAKGDDVLRIKGVLNVAGEARPVAIHGVQHVFHPPAVLPSWPDEDRRSKIVFIVRDLDRKVIEETFRAYMAAGEEIESKDAKPGA